MNRSVIVVMLVATAVFVFAAADFLAQSDEPRRAESRSMENKSRHARATESDQEPEWVARARSNTLILRSVLPLNNPSTVSVQDAHHMKPDDVVMGVNINGFARAYPWWVLVNYHVVNDTIGRLPLYVALCGLCSGSAAFNPIIDELPRRPLIFQVSGKGAGTFRVSDWQTRSTWHPFSGIAIDGPLKGRRLEKIPSVLTSWEEWKMLEPKTDVVLASERLRYARPNTSRLEIASPDRKNYQIVEDDRLSTNTMVFGLAGEQEQSGLAIPLGKLKELPLYQLDFDQRPIMVFADGAYRAQAFYRLRDGEVLSFERVEGEGPQFIDQFGTVWNQWGLAVSGPFVGAKLDLVPGYLTEWYEWVSYRPNTELF